MAVRRGDKLVKSALGRCRRYAEELVDFLRTEIDRPAQLVKSPFYRLVDSGQGGDNCPVHIKDNQVYVVGDLSFSFSNVNIA